MPLKTGTSQNTIASNIKHCMDRYESTGKVSGNSVGSTSKAQEICAAMAYSSARKSSKGKALVKHLRKK